MTLIHIHMTITLSLTLLCHCQAPDPALHRPAGQGHQQAAAGAEWLPAGTGTRSKVTKLGLKYSETFSVSDNGSCSGSDFRRISQRPSITSSGPSERRHRRRRMRSRNIKARGWVIQVHSWLSIFRVQYGTNLSNRFCACLRWIWGVGGVRVELD